MCLIPRGHPQPPNGREYEQDVKLDTRLAETTLGSSFEMPVSSSVSHLYINAVILDTWVKNEFLPQMERATRE